MRTPEEIQAARVLEYQRVLDVKNGVFPDDLREKLAVAADAIYDYAMAAGSDIIRGEVEWTDDDGSRSDDMAKFLERAIVAGVISQFTNQGQGTTARDGVNSFIEDPRSWDCWFPEA